MKSKRVGVLLSGCGVYDGAEIHEAVLTLLHLDRFGAEATCFAPDVALEVIDHVKGTPAGERRNVLVESARIARGKIADVASARAVDLDALVLPGGFGAAKNLSDFATAGDKAAAHAEVARLIREMHAAKKPMGFWCIAPAVAAAVLRDTGVRLTIGTDPDTAAALERMGASHEDQTVDGITVDREHRIVTTPCYMLAGRIAEVDQGIRHAVSALLELASVD